MMMASVSHFIDTLKSYKEKEIINLKQITGYGIPYTGSGVVWFLYTSNSCYSCA